MDKIETTKRFGKQVRAHVLEMILQSQSAHVGSSLSAVDVLSYLYGGWLKINPHDPKKEDRDFFILSKGHAAAVHYATLCVAGFFPPELLETYCSNNTSLPGHSTHTKCPGVEVSTGSLGHGLPIGVGVSLGRKREGRSGRVVVVISDGEINEGSNWEAFMFAAAHGLDNLVVVVDYNKIQSFGRVEDVMPLDPLAAKFTSFGWSVQEVDGHDHGALDATFSRIPFSVGTPSVIIAHTVKGRGLPDLENTLLSHYRPPTRAQVDVCLQKD